MTEDEAFIRAILAHTGDDTPRLVYADWLEDHSDPRAAYLRAEAGWAKPWRTGERPADSPELRQMTAGLDPVWMARVSRPPLGVCCDHFQWSERWPNADDSEVQAVERETGVTLPPDFRGFLLNNNGAHLLPSPLGGWSSVPVDYDDHGWCFHPIRTIQDILTSGWPQRGVAEASPEAVDWLGRLLAIGQGFEVIDHLMLGLAGREYGMICVIDSQVTLDTNYEWYLSGYKPHTSTFADFLSLLPHGFPFR